MYGKINLPHLLQVSKRFRDLSYAESLWINDAKMCFATNDVAMHSLTSNFDIISARDRVRISKNWKDGKFSDTTLLVQVVGGVKIFSFWSCQKVSFFSLSEYSVHASAAA